MEQRHAWITMEDGTRLAARLFLPDALPAPVVLDALPYRMDDLTASYASEYERLCEEGGFAVCRLDLRGTGSSEGIALDEYHAQEQADICEVIAWLAEQDWSHGRGRHVRHVVGGLQLAPGRDGAPARAARDRPDLRLRRPLHRRRPLHGRRPQGDRPRRLGALHGGVQRRSRPCRPCTATAGARSGCVGSREPSRGCSAGSRSRTTGRTGATDRCGRDYERITCPTMIVAGWADGYTNIALRGVRGAALPAPRDPRPVGAQVDRDGASPARTSTSSPSSSAGSAAGCATSENGIDEEPPIAVFVRRSTRAGARPRGDARRVARRADLAGRAAHADGPGARRATAATRSRARRRRHGGVDLVRGQAPVDAPRRPARGRRALADLRLGAARGRARDPGPPSRPAHRHVAAPRGIPLRTSLRRLPRRHVRAREPRRAQPHPPRRATTRRGRSSPASRPRSSSSSRRRRGSSRPGHRVRLALAGSDWPNTWPPPHAGTLGVERASVELELPVLDGPPVAPAPVFHAADRHGRRTRRRERRSSSRPSSAGSSTTRSAARRACVTSYGSRYDGAVRRADRRSSTTGSSASPTSNPGRAWASARATYEIAWPETTVLDAKRTCRFRSTSSAYHVSSRSSRPRTGPTGSGTSSGASSARSRAQAAVAALRQAQDAGGAVVARARGAPAAPGSVSRHASTATGQRGWKRQPAGTSIGFGVSPRRICDVDAMARIPPRHDREQRLRVRVPRVLDHLVAQAPPRRSGRGTSRRCGRRSARPSRGRA